MVFEKLGDWLHIWLCYVNDIFAIINIEDNLCIILNESNEIDQSIQSNMECELDNKLNYLECNYN